MSVKVYLLGAGPGDPRLITVKGKECLEQADIIIYDYLASASLLHHARQGAKTIFVGKKGFSQHITQDEINACLIEEVRALEAAQTEDRLYTIVRLKGGDPFVFGRGGEEALALAAEGIDFELIPGVTSGIAAPGYAGIPVTHRGISSSVAFITGNEDPTKDETSIDWEGIAKGAETLCFYMGIKNLPRITERLIAHGRAARTPVALVRWGTTPEQEILTGTLEDIADKAKAVGFQAPAIIVVGEVVNLREQLLWFERKPLFGTTVAVTRSQKQVGVLSAKLTDLGAAVVELPTIDIIPLVPNPPLGAAFEQLDSYQWLIFTSANGVECFFAALRTAGKDARALSGARVAAIGPATAQSLADFGVIADFVPEEYRAEAVADGLFAAGIQADDRVLLARAREAREVLPESLREAGVHVDVIPVYETVPAQAPHIEASLEQLVAGGIDAVLFTSSSTVTNFVKLVESHRSGTVAETLKNTALLSIGPITSETLTKAGLRVAAQAENYTIPGLIETLVGFTGTQGNKALG